MSTVGCGTETNKQTKYQASGQTGQKRFRHLSNQIGVLPGMTKFGVQHRGCFWGEIFTMWGALCKPLTHFSIPPCTYPIL